MHLDWETTDNRQNDNTLSHGSSRATVQQHNGTHVTTETPHVDKSESHTIDTCLDCSYGGDTCNKWFDQYLSKNLQVDTVQMRTFTPEAKDKFVHELSRMMGLRQGQTTARQQMLLEMEEADRRFDDS